MNRRYLRFFVIIGLTFAYTAFKCVQSFPAHSVYAILASAVYFASIVGSQVLYRTNSTYQTRRWFRALIWTGALAMSFWATFILISIPLDLLLLVARIFVHLPPLAMRFNLAVSAYALVTCACGLLTVLNGPRVKKITVRIKDLAPTLVGLKIVQLSDLHVGPTVRRPYVEKTARLTNSLGADLILFTGDIADGFARTLGSDFAPLRQLKSRYGNFYITGNHEYYWDAQSLIDKARGLGFTPLVNENRVVEMTGGAKVLVAGITDPMGAYFAPDGAPNIPQAAATTASVQLKILLAHRPEVFVEAAEHGFDLQFSGHTHGGQFFPFSLFIGLAHKFSRGLYRFGALHVYVNPGTGYWGPPNRIAVPPEITLVTLDAQ